MPDPTTTFRLSRRKGFRMPVGGVSVARPSRWGNPFRVGVAVSGWADGRRVVFSADQVDAEVAVWLFTGWLMGRFHPDPDSAALRRRSSWILDNAHDLAGRPLGCWCEIGTPCHRDVLARMAAEAVAS